MNQSAWVLINTVTTGFAAPIFVVEIGAQRMRGWEPEGAAFCKLLNQNCEIPPEASRVHGYTREILERDGEPAGAVYAAFRAYAGDLPLVSYNAEYDLDRVLLPEWTRLGIAPIGTTGFCALRLAQRLLDPVPAGNCKLQTLRQYYRLPERGAHTALGDVETVADLMANVLRPIAEQRGLDTWEKLTAFASEEWYPSRIAFGKHKGRCVWDAREDATLRAWLEWLAKSSNARSASMGRWYLGNLDRGEQPESGFAWGATDAQSAEAQGSEASAAGIVLYVNPEALRLAPLVAAARARLAELEAAYTVEKARAEAVQAALFKKLAEHYRKRDSLKLVVSYRKKFLDSLLRDGEDEAEHVGEEFRQAKAQTEREYDETAAAMESKHELSGDEADEMGALWRKLVRLYHPDRFANEPGKLATYEKLTSAINHARDTGDLATLREIANDPDGFIFRKGWGSLDFRDGQEIAQLKRLWESLEMEIVRVLESTNRLRESAEYELAQLVEKQPGLLDTVAAKRIAALDVELAELKTEAARLAAEIEELTPSGNAGIV
jgi:DNA polymerase III epsilon subunit-like protein